MFRYWQGRRAEGRHVQSLRTRHWIQAQVIDGTVSPNKDGTSGSDVQGTPRWFNEHLLINCLDIAKGPARTADRHR